MRVQNDILEAIDSGKCVFLVLLDLSAAFDTVSHDILLDRLSTDSGISGSALSWISSYLTNRTQSVLVSGKYSDPAHLRYGVPQGSVLGTALFSDYSSPVASLIRSLNIIAHCYADDTQLYVPFTPAPVVCDFSSHYEFSLISHLVVATTCLSLAWWQLDLEYHVSVLNTTRRKSLIQQGEKG